MKFSDQWVSTQNIYKYETSLSKWWYGRGSWEAEAQHERAFGKGSEIEMNKSWSFLIEIYLILLIQMIPLRLDGGHGVLGSLLLSRGEPV